MDIRKVNQAIAVLRLAKESGKIAVFEFRSGVDDDALEYLLRKAHDFDSPGVDSGGRPVTHAVAVVPKGEKAARWMQERGWDLEQAFMLIHTWDRSLASHHPHGILMERENPPELPSIFVTIYAHWDRPHQEQTARDVREALRQAGAQVDDFAIEDSDEG